MNERDLLEEVQSIRWENELLPAGNVNEIFNSFYSCISAIIDRHAPLKRMTKSEVKFMAKPWITTAIRKSIKKKNEFFKIYLKNKCEYNHCKYKIYRNKLKHLIIVSKKFYFFICAQLELFCDFLQFDWLHERAAFHDILARGPKELFFSKQAKE